MAFLVVAIALAALILLRKGSEPRYALIVGNSMEPCLLGPGVEWTCKECERTFRFGAESISPDLPFQCPLCGMIEREPLEVPALDEEALLEQVDRVQYFPQRIVASRRARQQILTDSAGMLRGDLVIFQPPEQPGKEIKRIVGFPGETVLIKDGDLWVDGRPWKKDSEALLKQAIFLSEGEWTRQGNPVVTPFMLAGPEPLLYEAPEGGISNQWLGNQRDSQATIPVRDIGVAFHLEGMTDEWQLQVHLRTPNRHWQGTVDASGKDWSISSMGQEEKGIVNEWKDSEKATWLVFAMVDGDGVIAINDREILRVELERSDREESTTDPVIGVGEPIELECSLGEVRIVEMVPFRDLHYRGALDAPEQTIPAGNGIVVLGDNIRLSSDSRNRWDEGLNAESISGILESRATGMEHLLRQRRILPK